VEEAFDVLFAHRWKDEWAEHGETDLAAVGVAGEHEVDVGEAWVLDDRVDEVRLVAHEEHRGVWHGRDGEVEITGGGAGVAGAGEPEVILAAFDGDVVIHEHGGAVGFKWLDNLFGADGDVVVAEDAVTLRGFEAFEDFGADAGGFPGDGLDAGAAADEVSGEEDKLGIEFVDALDDAFEEPGLGVLDEMDVAELDDAEVLEGVREVADGEGAVGDFELVARVGGGVGGETKACCGASDHEGSTADRPNVVVTVGCLEGLGGRLLVGVEKTEHSP